MMRVLKGPAEIRRNILKSARSPHFWIIVGLTIVIFVLYYTGFPTIKERAPWLLDFRVFEYVHNIQGSLLYISFIYAAITFGWVGLTTVWIVSLAVLIPRIVYFTHNSPPLSTNITFLTVPVLLILLIVIISQWVKSERKIYLERETQRQTFMSHILKAHEDERKRISQELHDDTIQTLLALTNRIHSLLNNRERHRLSPAISEELDSFCNSIVTVTGDLRRLCVNLRPSILDDIGLLEAIRSLVDNINSDTIKTRLVVTGDKRELATETSVMVYRFIQEALNNVSRHSEASEAVVSLDFGSRSTMISVRDNGKGFVMPKQLGILTFSNKLGIIGMQERTKLLGGTFNIRSEPGKGTIVNLEF